MTHTTYPPDTGRTLRTWLHAWDIRGGKATGTSVELFHAAPGCVRSATAFPQSERWATLDADDATGCIRSIRSIADAHTVEGGLAVLRGNISVDGCVVKTARVEESIFKFSGPTVVTAAPSVTVFSSARTQPS